MCAGAFYTVLCYTLRKDPWGRAVLHGVAVRCVLLSGCCASPSHTKLFLCCSMAAKYSLASLAEEVPRPVGVDTVVAVQGMQSGYVCM
jgi:hypothetical protein